MQACDAENKKALHLDLIGKWIEENPPGMGNGWEPYPLSLRIINWIKWVLDRYGLPDEALYSLAVQTRYLFKKLEYHLLGNHLYVNAKALVFAGLFFDGSCTIPAINPRRVARWQGDTSAGPKSCQR